MDVKPCMFFYTDINCSIVMIMDSTGVPRSSAQDCSNNPFMTSSAPAINARTITDLIHRSYNWCNRVKEGVNITIPVH